MRAVDTNILVRAITFDDPTQAEAALADLDADCFVSNSVLLETVWVLRSVYGSDRRAIAGALTSVLAGNTVHVSTPDRIEWAISAYAAGHDFADLIHLVEAIDLDGFVTFDRALAGLADAPVPVQLLR